MRRTPTSKRSAEQVGLVQGFRSGLEGVVGQYLRQCGVAAEYETHALPYTPPSKVRKYTPDFVLPNGIILETKGRFVTEDRQKMLVVKDQHPDLDIRFVFSNPNNRIGKQSSTTYAMWCRKNDFLFSAKLPPLEWLNEPPNEKALAALETLRKPPKR